MNSILDFLVQRAASHPEAEVILDFDGDEVIRRTSAADLLVRVRKLAAVLMEEGLAGERVIVMLPQGSDFVVAMLACFAARSVAIPLPVWGSNKRQQRFMNVQADSSAAGAIVPDRLLSRSSLPEVPDDFRWLGAETCAAREAEWGGWPELGWTDLAYLQYTSGSTGEPKGVMISHGNILTQSDLLWTRFPESARNLLVWIPLYHDMGLCALFSSLKRPGSQAVLMDSADFLRRPLHVLNASKRLNLHVVYMPNFALELCVRQASEGEAGDWSSICCMPSGGEAIQPDAVAQFEDRFASRGLRPGTVQPGYGLAEATLLLTALPLGLQREVAEIQGARRMANGPVVPGIELAIVHPERQVEMSSGEMGEVWARGTDNIGLGYWNRAEETEATFKNTLSGRGAGWLRTGDLGVLQSDQLFITGRIKNLFIFNGVNYHPEDLEASLAGVHPMVPPNGVLTFAAEDPERLVVLVEVGPAFRRFDRWVEPAEGIAEVLNRDWQLVPDEIQFLPFGSIPKTTSGKPRRKEARDRFDSAETRPMHIWHARQVGINSLDVNELLQELAVITGRAMGPEKMNEPLEKLRLQSIEAAAFAGALSKRFKKKVHPLDLQKFATLSELFEELSR